jgi:hypothetical protein
MSKGKIRKPKSAELPANLSKVSMEELVYHVVQTCDVEVDNEEWESADKKLNENLSGLEVSINGIAKRLGDNEGNISEEIKSIKLEIEELKIRKPLDLVVKINDLPTVDLGKQHFQLPLLLRILATKSNVYLVGPAGAGKTHAAEQCAKALNIPFYFTGAVASEFKLTGFMNAQGVVVRTAFREAYENGGLFLFDEIDASYPQAVLAFNAALANGQMDFPDKTVIRNENFYCIAAANTFGQGADRQYVGRNQLDAASLDRFVFIDWNYDEVLERDLAKNDYWTDYVQKVRRFIRENGIKHVVSPRATINGAQLLRNGIEIEMVELSLLWKGLDRVTINKIKDACSPVEILAECQGTFVAAFEYTKVVEKGEIIGYINYADEGNEPKSQEVLSPYNGSIYIKLNNVQVEINNSLAEIQSYDNK